jgi:hypothetical protein
LKYLLQQTNTPAIQKQQWHSREAQIEPPLIECECEWALRIRAVRSLQQYQRSSIKYKVEMSKAFDQVGMMHTSLATTSIYN